MISQVLKQYIQNASMFVRETRGNKTTLVHILLSILDDEEFQFVLKKANVDYLSIRQWTIDAISERAVVSRQHPTSHVVDDSLSALTIYTLSLAARKALSRGSDRANPLDFIAAILEVNDNESFDFQARVILFKSGLNVTTFAKARSLASIQGDEFPGATEIGTAQKSKADRIDPKFGNQYDDPNASALGSDGQGLQSEDIISRYFRDMTTAAASDKLDRSANRENTLYNMQIVLGRRKKGNVILVGDPGVGKTSLVEELACQIVQGSVGQSLSNTRILALDMPALIGGTRYRGDLEERLKSILDVLKNDPSLIVFIDEIHTLMSPSSSAAVAADILKPALAAGDIRCIGATTHSEYKQYFESDGALSRRFMPIFIEEPSRDDAIEMLKKTISSYEAFHGVRFPEKIIELAVDKTISLIPERKLPDKAIDIIDDLGSRCAVLGVDTATTEMLSATIFARTGKNEQKLDAKKVVSDLMKKMPGHENSAQQLAHAYMRRTLPGYLGGECEVIAIVGPESVDNTLGAKAISQIFNKPYVEIDMSEFYDSYTASSLTGAPPGYVGYESGGSLYNAITRARSGILVLKNIHKADFIAQNIVKTAIRTGSFTDKTQRTISLASTQVIVTMCVDENKNQMGFHPTIDSAKLYGIDLVDEAETIVKMSNLNASTFEAKIRSDFIRLEKRCVACDSPMTVNSDTITRIAQHLASLDEDKSHAFKRLVEIPVLDYLVSNNGPFAISFEVSGVKICKYEMA